MLLYSVYIKIFLAQKGLFVSSDSLQSPPCLIEKASPSRDLRSPRSLMSWRPGQGFRCRGWWGQGRPGARTASCSGRTRCSSRRLRGRRGPSARRATRRRTAAAVKREILVKVIQLVSLLASFNFLKVSSFSDPDGLGFQDWTLIVKDLLLFTIFLRKWLAASQTDFGFIQLKLRLYLLNCALLTFLLLAFLSVLGGDVSEGLALGAGPGEVKLGHGLWDLVEDAEHPDIAESVQLYPLAENTPQEQRLILWKKVFGELLPLLQFCRF